MIKNIHKKGVTLMALVVTILISVILITASIAAITNVVANNRIANFVEEMSQIENQVKLYYIENNSIQSIGAEIEKTNIIEWVNINNYNNRPDFIQQFELDLNLNNDSNAQVYYQLDLSKIDIDRYFDEGDIYVVAYPSLHVYYLKGIEAKGNIYYSISDRISGGSLIRNSEIQNDENSVNINESDGIKITKKNGKWSSKLGITINTYMESTEKLYIVFNDKEVLINTKGGQENTISFDTLISNVEGGLLVSDNSSFEFTQLDMESLSDASPNTRFIEVIKKNTSGEIIAKNKVNTFNLDVISPSLESSKTKITSLDESNEVTLHALDLQSGVKEIRYEYYTTYDRIDGKTGSYNYYSGNEIDKEYLQYCGKIAEADINSEVKISLPKGVTSIKLSVVDNAFNMSDVLEIVTMPPNSIYYSISDISKDSISILFYGGGITSGSLRYGPNDQEYGSSINWEAEKVVVIENLSDVSDKLYLKVKSGNGTRLIILEDVIFQTTIGTKIKEKSLWNNPYIPNGFIHTEGTVESGFVIQDISNSSSKYNEFVWIPVDNEKIKFGKEEFGVGTIASFQNILVDNINSFNETSILSGQIEESVKKYGGFYVARYEASKDSSGIVRSVKNVSPWNNVSYADALLKSNLMYENTDVKTTIMSAGAYDTIIKWLSYSKYNVTKESDTNSLIGNFSSSITLTGSNENYAMNNIYDLAGNVVELTSETYKNYPVFRGGAYNSTGANMLAAVRAYNDESHILGNVGFRPIMYII